MYPPWVSTSVEVETITDVLEGAAGRAIFEGVATIVAKLLNMHQAP